MKAVTGCEQSLTGEPAGLRWDVLKIRTCKILGVVVLFLVLALAWMFRVRSGPIKPTGKVSIAQGWKAVTVIEGLDRPWSVAWLPGGDALITERSGRLRLVKNGRLQAAKVTGLEGIFSEGNTELMEVSLHPRFSEKRWVYLTYRGGTEEANHTRVARGRLALDGASVSEATMIFGVTPQKSKYQHFGSRIVWLPDETFLLALGDGGNPPIRLGGELMREQAQRLTSQLGKILRLRDDGTAALDNPFANRLDANPFVWSYGHRNIQGLARAPLSGRIWANEHGSRGGDELNLLTAGANYGWPRATYSIEYTFGTISRATSLPGMVDPLVVWTPAQAPSGLAFYTGDSFPEWRGDLFSGALKRKEIRRIDLDTEGRVIGQESLPIGDRVRDVRQGPDGFLYVLTDEKDGRLLRIEKKPES